MNIWERMEKMDRRWIYLMVGIAVIIPFFVPAKFPISITPEAQSFYDAVEALPDGVARVKDGTGRIRCNGLRDLHRAR